MDKTYKHIILFFFMLFVSLTVYPQTNVVGIETLRCGAGKEVNIPVALTNYDEVVALQLKLELPFAMDEDSECRLSDRSNGHSISVRRLSGNTYLFVIFSASNKPVRGGAGDLFYIPMRVPESCIAGEEYKITCSQQIISDVEGRNICNADFEEVAVVITDEPRPDLKVGAVCVAESSVVPGGRISLSWTVTNVGDLNTSGGWKENVSLVSVSGERCFLGTVYHEGTLHAGGEISRQADFNIPSLPGIDGKVSVEVTVVADKDCGELPVDEGNNTAWSENSLELAGVLSFEMPASAISENYSSPIACKLYRSGSRAANQTFKLFADDAARLQLPEEVEIKAGQSGSLFYISVKDNDILDEDSLVTVSASGCGYDLATAVVRIEDDELPKLSVEFSKNMIEEGEAVTLTVTAERALSVPLTVFLSCDYSKRFTFPSQVVIPQGGKSASVEVTAVDDNLPDMMIDATFTAVAEHYESGEGYVMLDDDDVPEIELILTPHSVAESAGSAAVIGKLRRTTNKESKVTVVLTDNADGELIYSSKKIVLEPGVEENMFVLGVKDNNVVDGTRVYDVTASVYISSCNCSASGTTAGTVSQKITICDDDGPALGVRASKTVVLEGATAVLTLSRNTSVNDALTVSITSDNDDCLEYEHEVAFPVGAASIDIPVVVKKNDVSGDDRTVTFTVSGENFSDGTCWMMITDRTLPDAYVSGLTLSSFNVEAKGTADLMIKVANGGEAFLPARTKLSVYFNGYLYTTLYTGEDIAPGESEIISESIDMPDLTGDYTMKVVVNESQTVNELFYGNNSSEQITVRLLPCFTATVSSDKSVYAPGEKIVLKGQASGSAVANTEVDIYVVNAGYRHVLKATTDEQGAFTAEYTPYAGQIGHFTVGACYPNEKTPVAQAEFDVVGFEKRINGYVSCETLTGETYNGSIRIYNPSNIALTGITADVISAPANCNVDVSISDVISGYSQMLLNYQIKGYAPTLSDDWETLRIRLTSAEGASTDVVIYYYCRSPKAELKSNISQIQTTATKGTSRDYSFVITNTGQGETGKITFALPQWMSVVTGETMASLSTSESATVILRITPTEDMQLNVPVTGTIGINMEHGDGIPLAYSIEPVSDVNGTLVFDVCDENTYYSSDAPHVQGAKVVVQHPVTGIVIAEGVTGTDGIFSVTLPEGYYSVSVTADKHDVYKNNLLVSPSLETKEIVNLSCQGININYKLEETTIPDVYSFKQEVKFETNVPVPQVVLSVPEYIPADTLSVGNSLIFLVSLKNEGLITAQDVELLLPGNLNTMEFASVEELAPFDIAPQQTVVVPVRVTKTAVSTMARARIAPIDDDPCVNQIGTLYYWDCGPDRKWHRYGVAFRAGSCGQGNSGNEIIGDGDDNDDDGKGIGNVSREVLEKLLQTTSDLLSAGSDVLNELFPPQRPHKEEPGKYEPEEKQDKVKREDKGCEPCQNRFMVNLASCIPAVKVVVNGAKEAKKVMECVGAANSDKPLMDKFRQCPYSKGIVEGAERLYNVYTETNQLIKAIWNKETSEADYKSIGETLLRVADVAIDYYVNSESSNEQERRRKEIVKNTKALLESGWELKQSLFTQEKDYAQAYNALQNVTSSLGNLMEAADAFPELAKKFTNTGKFLKKYSCIAPLLEKCDLEGSEVRTRSQNAAEASALTVFKNNMSQALILIETDEEVTAEIFGDDIWLDIPEYEMAPLRNALYDASEPLEYDGYICLYKPKEVTDEQFKALIERWNNSIFSNTNTLDNVINSEKIGVMLNNCNNIINELENNGETAIEDLLTKNLNDAQRQAEESAASVCSSVSLQFSQKMVMTRQTFRGTLTVFNGHESDPMENVKVSFFVLDDEGKNANSKVQMSVETLDAFSGELSLDDEWNLSAQTTGTAAFLFIPTKYAAEKEAKKYTFGGEITYTDPFTGLETTRSLLPVTMTVNPSPNLDVDFFIPRDVFADDPLTEAVEKSVPAEMAVLINNIGYGDAKNVNFSVQQPQIVSNEKGLAIDMKIVGSSFNGTDKTVSLGTSAVTDFGTIPAMTTAYAQWWLESSLLGHFTDYDVSATHVTSFGNEDLSLLNNVAVHELIHSVRGVSASGENLAGFLVNDIIDAEDLPDMLYLSDGTVEKVDEVVSASCRANGSSEYVLTLDAASDGWGYAVVSDPTRGRMTLSSVRRSDGSEVDVHNFWQTYCTLRDGKEPLYENRLHLADRMNSGTSTYTLTYVPSLEQFEVSIMTDGYGGTVCGAVDGMYDYGTTLTLVAVPEEGYVLKSWTVNGEDMGSVEVFSVMIEQDTEILAVFEKEEVSTLDYALAEGWNWISHGLKSDVSISVFGNKAERIVAQTEEVVNDSEYGLVGNLSVMRPLEAYKVKLASGMDIAINGYKLDATRMYVNLRRGWNWMGCPVEYACTLADAFLGSVLEEGDAVCGQDGYAVYENGEWCGTLDVLVSGNGYLYKSVSDKRLFYNTDLSYSSKLFGRQELVGAEGLLWSADKHKYPNTMNITSDLYMDEVKVEPDVFHVGAFCGEECRGVGKYVQGMLYLTVYGEGGEAITYKAVDCYSGKLWDIEECSSFVADVIGSRKHPYLFHLLDDNTGMVGNSLVWKISPSTTTDNIYVSSGIGHVDEITITSSSGTVVLSIKKQQDGAPISLARFSPGVYVVYAKSGGHIYRKKIVKY